MTDTSAADFMNPELIKKKIAGFKASTKRAKMIQAENYYDGQHDILKRKRQTIGKDGELVTVDNLPNNHVIDNQYRKMVIQKTNYLLGQPITFQSQNPEHAKALHAIFNRRFMRTLKNVGRNGLNAGIGFIYVHYNEQGDLCFKRFEPTEFIPVWKDKDHTEMMYGIRFFQINTYEGSEEKNIDKVEVYTPGGVFFYVEDGDGLIPDKVPYRPYFIATDGELTEAFNWLHIPIIPFKYNADELSLLTISVKSLQDGMNSILSNFQNTMEEDMRNTLMVLVNFDGANLGEFRQNLAQYGVVKVRNSQQHPSGDVRTLTIEVNAENYKSIIQVFKKALIENAMGYDAKDDRMGSNANQMNIESMYNDINMDTNETELEYQASFEMLLWFVHHHLSNTGKGDWQDEPVEVIFNRDMMMNETEIIDNVAKSVGILSDESVVANHPYVNDLALELKRIKQEKAQQIKDGINQNYGEAFGKGEF